MDGVTIVFVAVVGARFVLPLFIPRFPLPAIIGCLSSTPPTSRSSRRSATTRPATRATTRRWTSSTWPSPTSRRCGTGRPCRRTGWAQFLYFYRLVGVVAFELTQARALLLVFPNTFEYFFIAYEGDPDPLGTRAATSCAGGS